jgi:hypothetical protein
LYYKKTFVFYPLSIGEKPNYPRIEPTNIHEKTPWGYNISGG